MARIDAHQHFWQFDPVRDAWITPDMAVIQRDFGPDDLLPLLQQHRLDGCVAVQASQSEQETRFLLELAAAHSFIKGVVGWVDLQADDIAERLAHFQHFEQLKGFRHVLQGEADRALMLTPAFRRGIGELYRYGFAYDLLILPDQLVYAAELADAFSTQPFVVDHLAKPLIKAGTLEPWRQQLRKLAARENVLCKVSGLVTEADWHGWQPADFRPYLDAAFEAFGPQRLMYGSDWPVCNVAGGYSRAFALLEDYLRSFSAAEQAHFWGDTATQFYRL
ncbi:amidohydrolase family protein [Hymenobacter busanensis]|uniref:Amidohydrolase family protein n=1 Tax=Hymenobacter busanensis TaxID=2607656 RepID=A0A7L4ZZW9_9BACT|nr:amidohydrolase family protein [Hymenobacter busanensis]KAA9331679.1 amidohydrolase family protein [Hymenobacter busanensis]QHJ08831.1 amidohydrolase family protein [Hymenobacter busanensis]